MNTDEMLAIASIRRYAASWFECLPAAAIVLALVYLEPALEDAGRLRGFVPATARQWQAFALCGALALFSFGLTGAHGSFSHLWYSARSASASARQNYWLDLKEQYGLPEGASYLMYVEGMGVDTWHERYVWCQAALRPVIQGLVDIKPLITNEFPLADIKKGFDLADRDDEAIKIVFRP